MLLYVFDPNKTSKFVKSFEKLQNSCTIFSKLALICIFTCKYTCSHVKTVLMKVFDHQNMGLEAIIFQLSGKDIRNNRFLHNGVLIGIKMAQGTYCQLCNIANCFLRIFPI